MTLMERRRALMGLMRGENIVTGTATVESGYKLTIPASSDKNFIIICNEAAGTTWTGGDVVEVFRLASLSDSRVYSVKNNSPGASPPTLGTGAAPTNFIDQKTNEITITAGNRNTIGVFPVGWSYRYFIW